MPYTANPVFYTFNKCMASQWYKIENADDLIKELGKVDYSVIDSRRKGHDAINKFREEGFLGRKLFSTTTRFPDNFFVSTYGGELVKYLSALETLLSYRPQNVAKDTTVGVGVSTGRGKDQSDTQYVQMDQGLQDNIKRFEEVKRQIQTHFETAIWTQPHFEEHIGVTWGAAGQ